MSWTNLIAEGMKLAGVLLKPGPPKHRTKVKEIPDLPTPGHKESNLARKIRLYRQRLERQRTNRHG